MATITTVLSAAAAMPVPGTTFPAFASAGTSVGVQSLTFDAAAIEGCQWVLGAMPSYGSGNLTVKVRWYGDTATSGAVVWGAAIAALTPETDTTDVETDTFATENTVTDTHLGTTAQRVMEASVTVSNLDSVAAGDYVVLRLRRVATDGADTMTGDAQVVAVVLEYSDT